MIGRRNFLRLTTLGSGLAGFASVLPNEWKDPFSNKAVKKPVVISTWNHGLPANEAAWEVLKNNGSALDAVQQGVMVTESDPNATSVGYGGLPDRDGNVTLDACIMNEEGNAGSVAYLQHIKNPVAVARKVMEDTPHVMLVGDGALQFALENGFKKQDLLTDKAKQRWKQWLEEEDYEPVINIENHDTIGMLAIDQEGNLSGACTTSGLAFKMQGRVGDSPIIGSGLFVDNAIGAACATGMGEAVIKTAGSHLIVELMRQGLNPQEACRRAVLRIVEKQKDYRNFQVAYLAMNKNGETGSYCIQKGFSYALYDEEKGNRMHQATSRLS